VFVSSDDFSLWKVLMRGPEHTSYEDGQFLLYVSFDMDYPYKAPQIRFLTPIVSLRDSPQRVGQERVARRMPCVAGLR
jgi:ubiquitin-protein ligase